MCQPRHLLEVGIKGHLVAVARHKRNLQRLARALDRIGELGRKATARRALMCAEVLTHDLLVRRADTGVVAPPCASSCRSGEQPRSLSIVFGGGSLGKRGQLCGGFFYAFPARAFYLLIAVGRVWSCLRLRELDHKSNQIKVWTKFLPHTRLPRSTETQLSRKTRNQRCAEKARASRPSTSSSAPSPSAGA